MARKKSRRTFLKEVGFSAAAAQLACGLPSLAAHDESGSLPKQRLVFVFSPNGVIPEHFWPDADAPQLELKRILQPLLPFKDNLLTLHGLCNLIQGDGDGHMRGIGCLLTGIELFPGDVQGGSDTPAGWSQGISVDQYIRNQLQADSRTRTRFGSLEFGAMVPKRADTWTRMSYAGPNQPVAPIDNPQRMFDRLYGSRQNQQMLGSVLDGVVSELQRLEALVSAEDRHLLREHLETIRTVERELQSAETSGPADASLQHEIPTLPPNLREENDNLPTICRLQMDLMRSAFLADFARVASLQITNSVGQPRMRWLGIDEGHHTLSHEPDSNADAYEKLTQINTWYCEQVAYLAEQLARTPEPGGDGSMLDHTTIVWTNELGKGNSHTRNNIPFVLVGGGLGFRTGRAVDFGRTAHNRLLMTLCAAMGHPVESFGNPAFCEAGELSGLV